MKVKTMQGILNAIKDESKCVSHQVSAVIIKNGRIISTGYNGTPTGSKNCCDHAEEQGWLIDGKLDQQFREDHHHWSKANEVHAEVNAIAFAAKHGVSVLGADMYVSLSPCSDCAKMIVQSGIKRVIFYNLYDKNKDGWDDILRNSNVDVVMIP